LYTCTEPADPCTAYMRNIGNSIKVMQKLRGADIYCDSNWLGGKMFIGLKIIMKFQKGKPRWKVENIYVLLR